MEPATVIAITAAAATLAEKLVSTWSEVNGEKEVVVCIANLTNDVELSLVYQSGDNDSGQHGKFVGSPPPTQLLSGKSCLVSSRKSNWAWTGNTNGLVYLAKKNGYPDLYLMICWCVPLFGATYYHIQWRKTWKASDMRSQLLVDIAERQVSNSELYSLYGMQRVEEVVTDDSQKKVTLLATSTFGVAPLKVFIHRETVAKQ